MKWCIFETIIVRKPDIYFWKLGQARYGSDCVTQSSQWQYEALIPNTEFQNYEVHHWLTSADQHQSIHCLSDRHRGLQGGKRIYFITNTVWQHESVLDCGTTTTFTVLQEKFKIFKIFFPSCPGREDRDGRTLSPSTQPQTATSGPAWEWGPVSGTTWAATPPAAASGR